MGKLSVYARNKALDNVFNEQYTSPTTVYLALCTADPTENGTGSSMSEVPNSSGYSRKAIVFDTAAGRQIDQDQNVGFDELTGSLGTASHYAIVDSATHGAGNMLGFGEFDEPKQLVAGNTPVVEAGEIFVEIEPGEISDYLANKWLDMFFRGQTFTKPNTYVGWATATIDDDDTGSTVTEPSVGDYARVQVNPNSGSNPKWSLASGGALSNASAVAFAAATAQQGTLTSVFTVDASTAGNLLMYDNAIADQLIGNGDIVEFLTGDLDAQLT